MSRRLVHLIVCHTPNGSDKISKIHEAWESRTRAQSRAQALAQEDADKTKSAVPSGITRVQAGPGLWTVQKMVHACAIKTSRWTSLRTWTTQAVPLKDDVVERLAKVIDAEA